MSVLIIKAKCNYHLQYTDVMLQREVEESKRRSKKKGDEREWREESREREKGEEREGRDGERREREGRER